MRRQSERTRKRRGRRRDGREGDGRERGRKIKIAGKIREDKG